jgi:hypothetical protein
LAVFCGNVNIRISYRTNDRDSIGRKTYLSSLTQLYCAESVNSPRAILPLYFGVPRGIIPQLLSEQHQIPANYSLNHPFERNFEHDSYQTVI